MPSVHLNLGATFTRPYESDYAMWRRCLVANPGLTLLNIKKYISQGQPKRKLVADRLRELQNHSGLIQSPRRIRNSYKRHCPRCAKQLYHTDIYALPWLRLCPIHHCKLTTRCPVCEEPWPDLEAMAKRDCPGCGRPTIDKLIGPRMHPRNHTSYRRIGELYEFIDYDETGYSLSQDRLNAPAPSRGGFSWWREAELTSPSFPAFQACRHPKYSASWLDSLKIHHQPIQCRCTPVYPDGKIDYVDGREVGSPVVRPVDHRMLLQWPEHICAMERIVTWIAKQTGDGHCIRLGNYRNLLAFQFLDGPDACPYCLALSLWFFVTATSLNCVHYTENLNAYPFAYEAGFRRCSGAGTPFLKIKITNAFSMSHEFSSWFYRRGLEILFIEYLQLAFHFIKQIKEIRKDRKKKAFAPLGSQHHCTDRTCMISLQEDLFCFHYINEHPLDLYTPRTPRNIGNICSSFQKYRSELFNGSDDFDKLISPKSCNYEYLVSLHGEFREYLKDRIYGEYDEEPYDAFVKEMKQITGLHRETSGSHKG